MRRIIRRVFGKKAVYKFRKADLTETAEQLSNPARGWYQLYTFTIEQKPDFDMLRQHLNPDETLVLILIDIGSVGNADMKKEDIDNIREILTFFTDAHKDIILRVSYDHIGKALEREPSLLVQVLKHLQQVGDIIKEYSNSIFIYQGMLIGNWGEMHTSKFLEHEQLEKMAAVLGQYRGEETFLAVRRPMHWRRLHKKSNDNVVKADGMGLYDDAILGSKSDLGTFGEHSEEIAGWSNAWTREEELVFEDALCKEAPNGGEVVYGEGFWEKLSQGDMLEDLRKMHITYLNRMYDRQVLDAWTECTYGGRGVWSGRSVYDYVGAHLGYRYHIKNVKLLPITNHHKKQIEIEVENTGFANMYQEAELFLEWMGTDGTEKREHIKEDMRKWDSGGTYTFECAVQNCEGELYLSAMRKRDGMPIRFANISDDKGRVILGTLE